MIEKELQEEKRDLHQPRARRAAAQRGAVPGMAPCSPCAPGSSSVSCPGARDALGNF